eukprot:GHVT01097473.1.p1 GENE.GHVT01097473.1~~GHVT01097473.1.p1  ORF type:complete len:289 (+),score=70.21 GHVT01097473.1:1657-2523(+)
MMVEEGALKRGPAVEQIFGFHVNPTRPTFDIATRKGTLMAGADTFNITVTGRGGHAAFPHLTVDPIAAATAVVSSINLIAARELNHTPEAAGVVSVTAIHGGSTTNVIPSSAYILGTVRSFSERGLADLSARVKAVASAVAAAHRCVATVVPSKEAYPPVVNNGHLVDMLKREASPLALGGFVHDCDPIMGAEDFSFFAREVPAAFAWLGIGSGKKDGASEVETSKGLHNEYFAVDERILPFGAALHARLALVAIEELNQIKKQNTNEMDAETEQHQQHTKLTKNDEL